MRYIPQRARGTRTNVMQSAHAATSAAVQFNLVYPAPDKQSSIGPTITPPQEARPNQAID